MYICDAAVKFQPDIVFGEVLILILWLVTLAGKTMVVYTTIVFVASLDIEYDCDETMVAFKYVLIIVGV